jgi:serine/threonine protein phosphatase PrpC
VRIKKRLTKLITEEEITNLCQLQRKITQLKNNINQQAQQINQIINNYYDNITQSIVGVEGNIEIEGSFAPQYIAQQEQPTN